MSRHADCAAQIVRDIVAELSGRRGLRHEWEQIDPDIQREVVEAWTKIATKHLEGCCGDKQALDKSLDWRMLHRDSCEDATCTGCKRCQRCGALTRSFGFEDHLCFNCRNPPSD